MSGDGAAPLPLYAIAVYADGDVALAEQTAWTSLAAARDAAGADPSVVAFVVELTRVCRVCGCTEDRGCDVDGGCSWLEFDLCSACDPAADVVDQRALQQLDEAEVDRLVHQVLGAKRTVGLSCCGCSWTAAAASYAELTRLASGHDDSPGRRHIVRMAGALEPGVVLRRFPRSEAEFAELLAGR